ncbi:MAG: hypothetical protein Q4B48_08685, partial [Syntrophomonadaceae bacterium]|nr:hypothetical protein [Syntrophomonadaceae bacterium]
MGRKMWMGALVLAALLAVTACGGGEAQPPSGPDEAGPQPGVSVTDPAVLAWLWEDYLYGSIFTLGNGRDFDAAAGELPYRYSALEYAVWYLVMNDPEGMFDPATAEPFVALPDETVAEWARRLTGVELGSIDYARDYEYSSVFASGENRIDWSQARQSWGITPYTENTPWSIRLDEVTHDAQAGTYTARLAHYVRSGDDARVNRMFEYTLRETEDALQFVARRTIIPDISDLVSIEYCGQELDAGAVGAALKGELERFSYTIRVGDVMFVRHWPVRNESDTGYDYVLAGYDMAADAPIGRIELEEQNLYGVRAAEDGGWLLLLPDRVMQVDAGMKPVREIELPAPVAASRDSYDCMADGSGFVYMRGGDLMLLRDGEEKLLCSSPPVSRYGYELFIRYPELIR